MAHINSKARKTFTNTPNYDCESAHFAVMHAVVANIIIIVIVFIAFFCCSVFASHSMPVTVMMAFTVFSDSTINFAKYLMALGF